MYDKGGLAREYEIWTPLHITDKLHLVSFSYSFHCISLHVGADSISIFRFNVARMLWVIQREESCASLCTSYSRQVGKGAKSLVPEAAGRCSRVALQAQRDRETGKDAPASKKQKTQVDTTEAKL